MGCIIEFILEFVFEIVGELFVSIASVFLPSKAISHRLYRILHFISVVIAVAVLVCAFIGVVMLVDSGGRSVWGYVLISVSVAYIASAVIVVLAKK